VSALRGTIELGLAIKETPKIEIQFWNFVLSARGDSAVAAVKWPLTLGLLAIALAIASVVAWRAGLIA
jgi:hypothetical protein